MTAQKRETGRNYIGLLHEETEEQRVADISIGGREAPHHGSHNRPDGRDVKPRSDAR